MNKTVQHFKSIMYILWVECEVSYI